MYIYIHICNIIYIYTHTHTHIQTEKTFMMETSKFRNPVHFFLFLQF